MKISTIVGARPQFIKAAVVSAALAGRPGITEELIHTGQHFDANMSDVFFSQLGIPAPAHTLNIHSLSHGAMTGRMLEAIETLLLANRPDWVLVYGDTNSTIAGALAAAKLQIRVAHVEAGLRSFNRAMPEEINRISTDHLSDLLFAPTDAAVNNLVNEGIEKQKIIRTGDVMYDCALRFGEQAREQSAMLEQLELESRQYVLCTVHRAENTDEPALLKNLVQALAEIARTIRVVVPLHPRTVGTLQSLGLSLDTVPGVTVTEPLGYLDMVRLEQDAAIILTDSGGVQKEAYFHGVPCVTVRPQTEWTELVSTGWNRLCPLQDGAQQLVTTVLQTLGTTGDQTDLYGDGKAATQIVDSLVNHGR